MFLAGFTKIEGLDAMGELRCLYLQENCIKKIENVEKLGELHTINLTDNLVEVVENLGKWIMGYFGADKVYRCEYEVTDSVD